nr:hypothetical protein [uncultured Acetatifactor sp.]
MDFVESRLSKTTVFSLVLAGFIVAGTATAFATSANAQQAESVGQGNGTEIVTKPDSVPQVDDNFGIFFKDGGRTAGADTEAERNEHFRALEANVEKGLDRYAGFEEMYKGIDTSAPVTYIVK